MIRIKRPRKAPDVLMTKGKTQTKKNCDDYDSCPDDYKAGKKNFKFKDRSPYNAPSVKEALMQVHHSKCCYCEMRYPQRNLAIEHFRPKNGVKQGRNEKAKCLGYYWLVNDWDNLLLSCDVCNSTYKQVLFPLSNPNKRACSHHDETSEERPLFVNPAEQDPRDHIRFRKDRPIGRTRIGRVTIEELGLLKNDMLVQKRLERIKQLKSALEIIEFAKRYPQDTELQAAASRARKLLNSAVRSDAEFSSMARDFLEGLQV